MSTQKGCLTIFLTFFFLKIIFILFHTILIFLKIAAVIKLNEKNLLEKFGHPIQSGSQDIQLLNIPLH